MIILSSNNYLGLAGHPEVVRAGIEGLERYGAGTASVRFICGTFEPHHELERALADLSGTEAALTYVSCWNANEAVIPSLTDDTTVIFTDELNHASLIDAIRLSRPAKKVIYPHSDTSTLRDALADAPREARKLIVTDGVFSMEGDLAKLPEIVELAGEFDAVVVVDDSHGVGVLGETGRGNGRALRSARRGRRHHRDAGQGARRRSRWLRRGFGGGLRPAAQRSRPQLFSNALPPTVACSALRAVQLMLDQPDLLSRLRENTRRFRDMLVEAGYRPLEGEAAIILIIVGETAAAIALGAPSRRGRLRHRVRLPGRPRGNRARACRCQPRSSPSISSARSRRSGAFAPSDPLGLEPARSRPRCRRSLGDDAVDLNRDFRAFLEEAEEVLYELALAQRLRVAPGDRRHAPFGRNGVPVRRPALVRAPGPDVDRLQRLHADVISRQVVPGRKPGLEEDPWARSLGHELSVDQHANQAGAS